MELIDVRDGSQLWGRQYSRKLADTLAVQEDIAHEVTASCACGWQVWKKRG